MDAIDAIRASLNAYPGDRLDRETARALLDRLGRAEARIRHLEDTARVLVGEVLKAEAERDSARGYISELETAVKSRNDVVKHRDAWIKAVRELHWADKALAGHTCAEDGHDWPCPTVRALESVPPPRPE